MKIKSILLTAVTTLSLATATMAQVPNYVPTNGLVGWWPFNGNANDESGNGYNLSINGAQLTTDRFGINNSCFSFNGTTDYLSRNAFTGLTDCSISIWINMSNLPLTNLGSEYFSNGFGCCNGFGLKSENNIANTSTIITYGINGNVSNSTFAPNLNTWYNFVLVKTANSYKLFINGVLNSSGNSNTNSILGIFGVGAVKESSSSSGMSGFFKGKLDDIGIWNRALTQQEITALFNAVNCANNTTITPQTNSLTIGSTATFTATTSDPNPSYVWQSNFGQGFQTLNNFGNYSGVNTVTLNIANVQLPNHTQPIRVISTSGNCIDTSNIAVISILDTCIVTVYDTLLTTVTDTLIINATLTGLNPPSNLNTLKVYPNPANTHITIDYGNFVSMNGYTLKIVNAVGQTVFTTLINQQTSYIDLSTWTGNGIYFVQLIDTQNNTVENRKIVIQ